MQIAISVFEADQQIAFWRELQQGDVGILKWKAGDVCDFEGGN
jgi:hypothetical protein